MLASAANSVVRALLAPVCLVCRAPLVRPLDGPVCSFCWAAVPRLTPPLCDYCGDSLPPSAGIFRVCARCLATPPEFEVARSAGVYDGSLRTTIHAFKYARRRVLAAPLAALMRSAGADLLADADAVVPVPLHPWRALHRGFNQSDDLARYLGPPVWRVLRRVRHGPSQSRLTERQRRSNVDGAFARRPSILVASGLALTRLSGATLVVVDDVMTTGATIDACSRALLDAGARSVRGLTVARALVPRPEAPPRSPLPSTVRHR